MSILSNLENILCIIYINLIEVKLFISNKNCCEQLNKVISLKFFKILIKQVQNKVFTIYISINVKTLNYKFGYIYQNI